MPCTRTYAVGLILALSVGACSSDSSDSEPNPNMADMGQDAGPSDDGGSSGSCADNLTECGALCCTSDQQCVQGRCETECPIARCGAEQLCCASGQTCLMDTCCPSNRTCGSECCQEGAECIEGACVERCSDRELACGQDGICCGDQLQTCIQGACITPGNECMPAPACATRPEDRPCPSGQTCDPDLLRCIPEIRDETCTFTPEVGVFQPTPLFTWGQRLERACQDASECQTAEVCDDGSCQITWPHVTPTTLPDYYQASSIPMVTDLDGDCVPEIVFNTYRDSTFTSDGVLRAIRGDNGEEVFTVTSTSFRTDSTGNPAIGDVDGDGNPEIFVVSNGKELLRFASDGTPVWRSDTFDGSEGSGSAFIAQMDGEGSAEIVFGDAVFDADGNLLAEGADDSNPGRDEGYGGQGPISCVADLDGDGRPEIIAGRAVYASTGSVSSGDFTLSTRAFAEEVPNDGFCGIADMNLDGAPEVVLVSQGFIYVLQGQTLDLITSLEIEEGEGHGGAPNIADFDGDGFPDVGTAGATNYIVAKTSVVNGIISLSVLWRAPTEDDSSSRTGSSVFDFDGDGRSEVVYNDEEFVRIYPGTEPDCAVNGPECDGIMNDAEILFQDLNSSRTRTEYPVIADVDGDFKAEIVFATSNEAGFLDLIGDGGIEVWADVLDNWVATRPIWNQHAYAITNVGERGQIPDMPEPSWQPSFNAYRRNDQGGLNPLCAPDLQITDVVQNPTACPTIELSFKVANEGCLAASSAMIWLEGTDGSTLAASSSEALGPGQFRRLGFTTPGARSFNADFTLVVDPEASVSECREQNNRSVISVVCRDDF